MTEDERLKRMDRSLDSLERSQRNIERSVDGIENEVRLTREFIADQRTFTSQVVARMERSARDGMRELSRMNDSLERQGRQLERLGAHWTEESRMGRAALLRVLDRLDHIDPGTAPASS